MRIFSLIHWCDTDISSITHFASRERLVEYVANRWGEEKAREFREGGDYWTNECGFALEAVVGKMKK